MECRQYRSGRHGGLNLQLPQHPGRAHLDVGQTCFSPFGLRGCNPRATLHPWWESAKLINSRTDPRHSEIEGIAAPKDRRFNGPLPSIPDPRVPGRRWISPLRSNDSRCNGPLPGIPARRCGARAANQQSAGRRPTRRPTRAGMSAASIRQAVARHAGRTPARWPRPRFATAQVAAVRRPRAGRSSRTRSCSSRPRRPPLSAPRSAPRAAARPCCTRQRWRRLRRCPSRRNAGAVRPSAPPARRCRASSHRSVAGAAVRAG